MSAYIDKMFINETNHHLYYEKYVGPKKCLLISFQVSFRSLLGRKKI